MILVLVVGLLLPQVTGTQGTTALLEQVFTFGAFAMSYDLLLGFTGIVSFGHAMFFGTGAYVMGICLTRSNAPLGSLTLGLLLALAATVVLSLMVAFLSLRIRDTHFAMITLAVGQTFYVLAGSRALQPCTNSNDGITVTVPNWLNSDYAVYSLCFLFCFAVEFVMCRFVHSPVGVIFRGIRDNEARMTALGHAVFRYKSAAFMVSEMVATLAGVVFVLAQMFVSTQVYDVSTSLDVFLMTIIGGTGTLFGGLHGAGIIL